MKKFTLRLSASSLSDMMRTKVTSLLTTGLLVFVLGAAGLSNPRLAAAAANCVINIPINIICTVVGPVINSIVCSPIITIIVFGDVHEQDANGEITSNQIPGDFVVSRTADGSHEVQTRNVEYVPSSGIPPFPGGATVAAADAVKFAGHHAAVFRNTDSQPDLWLDGKPVETVVNGYAFSWVV